MAGPKIPESLRSSFNAQKASSKGRLLVLNIDLYVSVLSIAADKNIS
jgi:hypothetical protein